MTRVFARALLQKVLCLGSDILALTLAHMLASSLGERLLDIPFSVLNSFEYQRYDIPFFTVILYLFEGYKSLETRRPEQELERTSKAVVVGFVGLILFNFVSFRAQASYRYLLVSWFSLAFGLLLVLRFTLRAFYAKSWNAGWCRRRALLVGSPPELAEFRRLLSIQRHHGYEFVGALLDAGGDAVSPLTVPDVSILGAPEEWERAAVATGANVLVVAPSGFPGGANWLGKLLRRCKERRIDVELYSSVLATENLDYEQDEFSACFRLFAKPAWSLTVQRALKNAVDLAVGVMGSIVTLLLTPVIYALVYLDDRGPLFYRSAYVAQDGTIRFYLKFRTMHVDADQIMEKDVGLRARFREKQKLPDDPRVTRIGRVLRKYSLDEFPEFFSVLKGDLSMVGPRTIRQEETEHYGHYLGKLLSCKPGLTGFWQVMGRQTTTYQERVQMDMFYIDHWSIWLDLLIIAKTFWKVVCAEGAY